MRDLDRGRFLLPSPETVTLRRPASRLAPAAFAVIGRVQCQMVDQEVLDSPYGGTADGARRTFHLWRAECLAAGGPDGPRLVGYFGGYFGGRCEASEPAALLPYRDYEIERTDGTVWTIKKVETLAHGRRFRCHTVQRNDTTDLTISS